MINIDRGISLRLKWQYRLISVYSWRTPHHAPFAQQESVPYNLGLLLDAVARQRPAGLQTVRITAERVAAQRQEKPALALPDVRHLVDEQPLRVDRARAEIIAIEVTLGMQPDVSVGSHRGEARLEERPFCVMDANLLCIDRVAKDRARQRDLGVSQQT